MEEHRSIQENFLDITLTVASGMWFVHLLGDEWAEAIHWQTENFAELFELFTMGKLRLFGLNKSPIKHSCDSEIKL